MALSKLQKEDLFSAFHGFKKEDLKKAVIKAQSKFPAMKDEDAISYFHEYLQSQNVTEDSLNIDENYLYNDGSGNPKPVKYVSTNENAGKKVHTFSFSSGIALRINESQLKSRIKNISESITKDKFSTLNKSTQLGEISKHGKLINKKTENGKTIQLFSLYDFHVETHGTKDTIDKVVVVDSISESLSDKQIAEIWDTLDSDEKQEIVDDLHLADHYKRLPGKDLRLNTKQKEILKDRFSFLFEKQVNEIKKDDKFYLNLMGTVVRKMDSFGYKGDKLVDEVIAEYKGKGISIDRSDVIKSIKTEDWDLKKDFGINESSEPDEFSDQGEMLEFLEMKYKGKIAQKQDGDEISFQHKGVEVARWFGNDDYGIITESVTPPETASAWWDGLSLDDRKEVVKELDKAGQHVNVDKHMSQQSLTGKHTLNEYFEKSSIDENKLDAGKLKNKMVMFAHNHPTKFVAGKSGIIKSVDDKNKMVDIEFYGNPGKKEVIPFSDLELTSHVGISESAEFSLGKKYSVEDGTYKGQTVEDIDKSKNEKWRLVKLEDGSTALISKKYLSVTEDVNESSDESKCAKWWDTLTVEERKRVVDGISYRKKVFPEKNWEQQIQEVKNMLKLLPKDDSGWGYEEYPSFKHFLDVFEKDEKRIFPTNWSVLIRKNGKTFVGPDFQFLMLEKKQGDVRKSYQEIDKLIDNASRAERFFNKVNASTKDLRDKLKNTNEDADIAVLNDGVERSYDSSTILGLMRTKGFSSLNINDLIEFTSSEFFRNPVTEIQYAEQFHKFLTNKLTGSPINESFAEAMVGRYEVLNPFNGSRVTDGANPVPNSPIGKGKYVVTYDAAKDEYQFTPENDNNTYFVINAHIWEILTDSDLREIQ